MTDTDDTITTNDGADSNINDDNLTDTVKLYKDRLMEDLGFGKDSGITDVEREQTEKKMGELVDTRILNLIMLYMPEDKVREFGQIAEQQDQTAINDFVQKNIPGYEDKVLKELMDIKDELLKKAPVEDAK